jgi:hypothetical protein
MAENETATVSILHPPKPKTSAERNRAFRQRQKERSAIRSEEKFLTNRGKTPQPVEKPKTSADGDPTFAELERTTKELVEACQRGMQAARDLAARCRR